MSNIQKLIKICAYAIAVLICASLLAGAASIIEWGAARFGAVKAPSASTRKEIFLVGHNGTVDLDIELDACKLTVKGGGSYGEGIVFETNNENIKATEKNGTLTVEQKDGLFSQNNSEVTIILPSEISFNGAIASGAIGRLNIDVDVGDIYISSVIYGEASIECDIGDITLELHGGIGGYTVACETDIGKIKADGERLEANSTYGQGNSKINVSCDIGNIDIYTDFAVIA